MTPAASLRDEAARLRSQADRLDTLADALDGAPEARQETVWLETGVAAKLAGVDPETIRRWAVKHGSGYQTETKKWRHNRDTVLSIARAERTARAGNAARDAANAAARYQGSAKQFRECRRPVCALNAAS